jgi:hypothetical protein
VSLREVVFTLDIRHAITGRAMPAVRAEMVPPTPWWWAVDAMNGLVGVHALDRYACSGAAPVVRLSITDPLLALVVVDPVAELALTAQDTTHEYVPVPQTVTVDLVDVDGSPRTGRTVRAGTVPLPAVADEPGVYRNAARTWTAADTPFDLEVDGTTVRRHLDQLHTVEVSRLSEVSHVALTTVQLTSLKQLKAKFAAFPGGRSCSVSQCSPRGAVVTRDDGANRVLPPRPARRRPSPPGHRTCDGPRA